MCLYRYLSTHAPPQTQSVLSLAGSDWAADYPATLAAAIEEHGPALQGSSLLKRAKKRYKAVVAAAEKRQKEAAQQAAQQAHRSELASRVATG